MLYIYSLIFGIIQGITEFVPVSSSGHLVVLHDLLNFNLKNSVSFDVALHLGTALAVIIYFRIEILKYLVAILEIFIPKAKINKADLKDVLLIIYACIPAGIVGILFEDQIEHYLRSPLIVAISLSVVAILFFAVEKLAKHTREFTGLTVFKAIYIGLAQTLALIPGVSRSGITIIAGMSAKLKREESARFSFLISAPIILGAGILKLVKINWAEMHAQELIIFIIGFISAFIIGFLVIKYLLRFLRTHKLNIFAWYRLGLALVIFIWLVLK